MPTETPLLVTTPPTASPVQAAPAAPVGERRPRGDSQTVRMSWYRMGSTTANGEHVDPSAHNCAGASRYPMGSSLSIRNPENGRTVRVRINDRGAFEKYGRSLDCMVAVWSTLGIPLSRGVATVEVVA